MKKRAQDIVIGDKIKVTFGERGLPSIIPISYIRKNNPLNRYHFYCDQINGDLCYYHNELVEVYE